MDSSLEGNDKHIKTLINSFLNHWYIVDDFKDLEMHVYEKKFVKTKDGTTIFDILKMHDRIADIKDIYEDYEFIPLMQSLNDIIEYDMLHKLYEKFPERKYLYSQNNSQYPLSNLLKEKKYNWLYEHLDWWTKKDFTILYEDKCPLHYLCVDDPINIIDEFKWNHEDFLTSNNGLDIQEPYTPLYYLCKNGKLKTIKKFNFWKKKDFLGYGVLKVLITSGNFDIIYNFNWWTKKEFVKQNNLKITMLHYMCRYKGRNMAQMFKMLKFTDNDLHLHDNYHKFPLELLCENNIPVCIEVYQILKNTLVFSSLRYMSIMCIHYYIEKGYLNFILENRSKKIVNHENRIRFDYSEICGNNVREINSSKIRRELNDFDIKEKFKFLTEVTYNYRNISTVDNYLCNSCRDRYMSRYIDQNRMRICYFCYIKQMK